MGLRSSSGIFPLFLKPFREVEHDRPPLNHFDHEYFRDFFIFFFTFLWYVLASIPGLVSMSSLDLSPVIPTSSLHSLQLLAVETGGWEWTGNEVLEIRLSGLPGSEVRGMKLRITC